MADLTSIEAIVTRVLIVEDNPVARQFLVRVVREYSRDEMNSESVTTLQMHVGGGSSPDRPGRGIHWHMSADTRIEAGSGFVSSRRSASLSANRLAHRRDGQPTILLHDLFVKLCGLFVFLQKQIEYNKLHQKQY